MQKYLTNSSKAATFVKNDKFEFVAVTDGFLELFEIENREKIIGKTDKSLFSERILKLSATSDETCLKDGLSHYYIPAFKTEQDNSIISLRINKTEIIQNNKKYIIGTCVPSKSTSEEISRFRTRLKYFSQLSDDISSFALIDLTKKELMVLRLRSNEEDGKPVNILLHRPLEEFHNFMTNMIPDEKARKLYAEAFSYDKLMEYSNSGIPAKKMIFPINIINQGTITICQEFFFTINPFTEHLCVFLFGTDISKDIEEKHLLARQLEIDTMTGIYNHSAVFKHINEYLQSDDNNKSKKHAFCILDVNNFKHVNDIFGHKVGDDVIIRIANELKKLPSEHTIYGRLGGDEFVIFVKNLINEDVLDESCKWLINQLQFSLVDNRREMLVSPSVGIYIFEDCTENTDDIYIKADKALYKAKEQGGPAYSLYNESNDTDVTSVDTNSASLMDRYEDLNNIFDNFSGEDNSLYKINLTKNTVLGHKIGKNAFTLKKNFKSVDDLFDYIITSLDEDKETIEDLSEILSRKYLTLAAKRSEFIYEDGFNLIMHNVGTRESELVAASLGGKKSSFTSSEYFNLKISMSVNPQTQEVEAVVALTNANISHHLSIISDKIVARNYETISVIDTKNRSIRTIKSYMNYDRVNVEHPYDEGIKYFINSHMMEEDRHNAYSALKLSVVLKELNTKPTYSVPIDVFSTDVESQHKLLQFTYLDEQKRKIFIVMTNYATQVDFEFNTITGLNNRRGFYSRTRSLLAKYPERNFVIVRWDISGFKHFNDSFGMAAGDELLASIGNAMKKYINATSVVGNIGGDVFVLCLEEEKFDPNEMQEYISNLLDSLTKDYYFIFHMAAYKITNKDEDITIMCDHAQLALDSIKQTQNERFVWYKETMHKAYSHEQSLLLKLRKSLVETPDDFIMMIQPQYNLLQKKICGGECLVRWNDSELGSVSPSEFVPILEKTNLITRLDMLIWEKACQFLNKRIKENQLVVPLSINISRCDFYEINVVKHLNELTDRYEIPHRYFYLEITESAYTDKSDYIISIIKDLRKNGYIVEMDDFGSGYSSLNNLKTAPIDTIKIDMRFFQVDDNQYSEDVLRRGNLIVSSIVRLAKDLKLNIIAEGIETDEQAEFLRKINCPVIQGYLFSKPLTPEDFIEFIDSNPQIASKGRK